MVGEESLRASTGTSEGVWVVGGEGNLEGPGTCVALPSPPLGKHPTTDGQGGKVMQSNCSPDSREDPGPERGGDLLKVISSELELELRLAQSPDLCGLLPLCGGMDQKKKKKSQFKFPEGVSSSI